jgi:predicted nuclease of predicted toxin-antitoxin system
VIRFLLDENVPLASAARLRLAGHDVVHAIARETDRELLGRATAERRVIVTFDRDFGFLVFRGGAPAPPGIVYFRFAPATPEAPAEQLLALLETSDVTVEGKLTVVEPPRIRQRPLPGP